MEVAPTDNATRKHTMVIDLDDYRKSKGGRQNQRPARHCGESARWSYNLTRRALTLELPEDFSTVDMKAFIDRTCSLATQV